MIGEFFLLASGINRKIREVFDEDKDYILDLGCGANPKYHNVMKGNVVCLDLHKGKEPTL